MVTVVSRLSSPVTAAGPQRICTVFPQVSYMRSTLNELEDTLTVAFHKVNSDLTEAVSRRAPAEEAGDRGRPVKKLILHIRSSCEFWWPFRQARTL